MYFFLLGILCSCSFLSHHVIRLFYIRLVLSKLDFTSLIGNTLNCWPNSMMASFFDFMIKGAQRVYKISVVTAAQLLVSSSVLSALISHQITRYSSPTLGWVNLPIKKCFQDCIRTLLDVLEPLGVLKPQQVLLVQMHEATARNRFSFNT